jgi:hypothetical protein
MDLPELTRRRSNDAREECWHIYCGDVRVGTIAILPGAPHDGERWGWNCGFYPGAEPGEHTGGSAMTFEAARSDFDAAWHRFASRRTEADFQAWRDHRDAMARKYEMRERGERFASEIPNSMMRCPCGEMFDSHRPADNLIHVPHITQAQRTDRIER